MRSINNQVSKNILMRSTVGESDPTSNQKEGNGKYPQHFALSEQVCD